MKASEQRLESEREPDAARSEGTSREQDEKSKPSERKRKRRHEEQGAIQYVESNANVASGRWRSPDECHRRVGKKDQ